MPKSKKKNKKNSGKISQAEELRKINEELSLLYRASELLSRSLDLKEIYDTLYELVSEVIPCDGMYISSFDSVKKLIQFDYGNYRGNYYDGKIFPSTPLEKRRKGIQSRVIRSGKSLLSDDYQSLVKKSETILFVKEDGELSSPDDLSTLTRKIQSIIVIPVKIEDQVTGTIQVFSYEKGVYTQDHVRLVEAFGNQIAVVRHNAELYQKAQDEIAQRKQTEKLQEAVYQIAQAHEHVSSLDELYQNIHHIIQDIMPANNFFIAMYDETDDMLDFPYLVDEVDVLQGKVKAGKTLSGYVLRTGVSLLCTMEEHERLIEQGEVEMIGSPSPIWLGVPLKIHEKNIGVMVVQDYHDLDAYGPREQRILEYVSSQVARAIDHKRSDDALIYNEAFSRAVIDNSPLGISVRDRNGRLLTYNPAWQKIWAIPDEDLEEDLLKSRERLSFDERDDYLKPYQEAVKQVYQDGGSFHIPVINTSGRRPGSADWISQHFYAIKDEHGEVNRVVILTENISERKKAEVSLQESEARYKELFESMQTGFAFHEIICDESGKPVDYRYIEVNPAFEVLTGLKAEDLIGKTVLEVLPNTESYWIEVSGNVALTGESTHFENYSQELDRYYEMFAYCPKIGYFAVLFSDVTERVKIRKEIEQLNEDLESRVLERTAELQSTNEEIKAFAYSVSHDLRAPLRAISGFGEILRDEYAQVLDDDGKNYLSKIIASGKKMDSLIHDLLALSRLGRRDLVYTAVDLSKISSQILSDFVGDMPEPQFEIKINKSPIIQADEHLMEHLLTNLFSNALKFSRHRRLAVIEFGCYEIEQQNIFYVKDNGVGFDMNYSDKLFTPFQRLHTDSEFEGTGIGLAIAQRIVKRHNGEIWIESELENGTTVFFSLH